MTALAPEQGSPGEREHRPAWREVRSRLEQSGFRPSRRLGQNFLLDENTACAIVRDAQLPPAARVLEVGAGSGFLTLHLARSGVRLISVEIDARLLEIARDVCLDFPDIEWLQCDVLAGKHELEPLVLRSLPREVPWHLVGNLPYAIAAPLLVVLAELDGHAPQGAPGAPASMTVLVQREIAQRICAGPGTAEWGPLSIRLQSAYSSSIVRSVAPTSFWPRPKVESSVVRLERRSASIPIEDRERLDRLVSVLFQHRRQMLGRAFTRACRGREEALERLARAGIDPRARAEELDLQALLTLSRTWV